MGARRPKKGPELRTRAQVARRQRVNLRTIGKWVAAGLRLPTTGPDLDAWLARRPKRAPPLDDDVDLARRGMRIESTADPHRIRAGSAADPDLAVWSARYRQAKALAAMMETDRRRGKVIDRAEVERLFIDRVLELRHGLSMLGRRVEVHLDPEIRDRVRGLIDQEVLMLLERYSRPHPLLQPAPKPETNGTDDGSTASSTT